MSELTGIETKHVIPPYASFNEATLYVIEAMEAEYQNMMMNIGLKELGVLEESGEAMVYEGTSLKEIKNSFIETIKKMFSTVKGLFDNLLTTVKTKIDEFKKNVNTKHLAKLKEKSKNIKDKEYGTTYQYPGFDNLISGTGEIWSAIKNYEKEIEIMAFSPSGAPDFQGEKEKLCKSLGGDLEGKEIRTKLQEKLRGSEVKINKQYIINNIDDMFENATNYGKTVRETKKLFNEVKKSFDSSIAFIKKDQKKGSQYEEDYKPDVILNQYRPYLIFGKKTVVILSGVCLSIVKEKLSTDMKIIAKLHIAASSKPKNESAIESETIEPSTYQAELANLFAFN